MSTAYRSRRVFARVFVLILCSAPSASAECARNDRFCSNTAFVAVLPFGLGSGILVDDSMFEMCPGSDSVTRNVPCRCIARCLNGDEYQSDTTCTASRWREAQPETDLGFCAEQRVAVYLCDKL